MIGLITNPFQCFFSDNSHTACEQPGKLDFAAAKADVIDADITAAATNVGGVDDESAREPSELPIQSTKPGTKLFHHCF